MMRPSVPARAGDGRLQVFRRASERAVRAVREVSARTLPSAPESGTESRQRGGRSKLPQPNQHGECPLQLAVQVDLIPGGHIQILRSVGDAEE